MIFNLKAEFLRKVTATTFLEIALKRAVLILETWDIPHYVCGGFAVQERGYARMTSDVDIVVPNVNDAIWRLTQSGLFRRNQGSKMTVTDKKTRVPIDLMEGGSNQGPGPMSLPVPTVVSSEPVFLELPELLSVKLSSYMGSPIGRAKDLGDVVELIKANRPPRDYPVDPKVKGEYEKVWDALRKEGR